MTEEFKDLFKNLSPKERDVITLLLGLNDGRIAARVRLCIKFMMPQKS